MWSEHCSYKSSKVHLRQFGDLPPSDALLVGIGENAGVVDVGDGYAVTFKVESHNHPSYVEPYQGAATGVGGIVRDILTMGARPIAVMDSLRFGRADAPDTARVLPGVVAGVGGYGNCLGLPNIGGELLFDDCYAGNPLVNALCVGVMRHEDVRLAKAEGVGNKVILFGARTGGDGIGGVSVLASETFDERRPGQAARASRSATRSPRSCSSRRAWRSSPPTWSPASRTSAAPASPAPRASWPAPAPAACTSTSTPVPLRDSTLTPAEILMSESQERMCAIVEPAKVDAFLAVCRKWDVLATVIGEVTDGDRLTVDWHGERIVDVPPRTVAHEGPVYERPMARPADLDALQADDAARLPRPSTGAELQAHWLAVVASPDGADKTWVTEQYDRYVRGNTVLAQPEDAGVVRIDEESHRGIALALDGNARFARLDPYAGAQLNLAEAYRNVAVSGAKPLAVTNCLNFGSPEDPEVMWQFAEAVRGLADGCRELGLPVTGGNVSLYNQTGDVADQPDAGDRRARRARGRPPPGARRLAGGRRDRAAARRDARGVRRVGLGARRARPPRRPAAGGRPGGRARAGRAARRPRPRGRRSARPTTWPTAAWRRPSPSRRCGTASARGCTSTATRSSRCSASRPPAPSSRRPTPTPCGRPPSGPASRSPSWGRRAATRSPSTGCSSCRWPSCGRRGRRPCRRCSARPRRRSAQRSRGRPSHELMAGTRPDPRRGAARRRRAGPLPGWPARPSSRRGRCSARR